MQNCLFNAIAGTLTFDAILFDSTFPYLYLDLACKQLCFPPGKSINRRNESTTSELLQNLSQNLSELLELFRTLRELSIIVMSRSTTS